MIIEKAIKVLIFEKMEYYHNEMVKANTLANESERFRKIYDSDARAAANRVCAMAETISIIENTNEDAALAEFNEWLKSKEA